MIVILPLPNHTWVKVAYRCLVLFNFIDVLKEERDRTLKEMQRLCDQRVELVQRTEGEKLKALETQYRQQLNKVQQDLESMLRQQEHVIKVKNEVEDSLQKELETAQRDSRRQQELRKNERERYERMIADLKSKISELETRLKNVRTSSTTATRPSLRLDWSSSNQEKRLVEMQRQHDTRIASLVRQFEREKESALQILKTRIKAEVSLLVPRIKEQCQRAFSEKLARTKEVLASHYRTHYEDQIRKLQEEQAMERRLWQRQMRENLEHDRHEIINKLKAKYELRILDVRNECERRILQRLRDSRHDVSLESDDSFVI